VWVTDLYLSALAFATRWCRLAGMCGRYSLTATAADVEASFGLDAPPPLAPRYNIAPSQLVPIVRLGASGTRELVTVRWGLVPSFARFASGSRQLINARAETARDKPSFRAAWRARRCLVVADGFFEWQRQGATKTKTPYYVYLPAHAPFAIAGLWERWRTPDGTQIESCVLLTTAANAIVAPLHDRMPVILAARDYDVWLSPTSDPTRVQGLLVPLAADACLAHPVSRLVNSPAHDVPDCIAPTTAPAATPTTGELFR